MFVCACTCVCGGEGGYMSGQVGKASLCDV